MQRNNILGELYAILSDTTFKSIHFRPREIDFQFKEKGNTFEALKTFLNSYGLFQEESGNILVASKDAETTGVSIYGSYEMLFQQLYENDDPDRSLLVLNPTRNDFFFYEKSSGDATVIDEGRIIETFYLHNYRLYLPLLKLFRNNRSLTEFDDAILRKMLMIENGKEKNLINISYKIFDQLVFSKKVDFDFIELQKWVEYNNTPNHQEWISSFKHNVVFFISSQADENRTFTEIFLNLPFLIANTTRDYNIFMSGFSFEKISRELKDEKRKYFEDLNQAQDKIKSQVIAVPLSIGTSIYAFFQMEADIRTFYFILAMVGIYIFFICWYLYLYDRDLIKLSSEIKEETETFQTRYPGVYDIFKKDFLYITKKVRSVIWLSWVIKLTILLDWIILLVYILFVVSHPASTPKPYNFKFL
ncbi:hypothetical protein HDC90_001380 [Pedobacter sp. AK013]|uniref:hypothetical protein n=1 Tax=Pedobacter sp. AK013 TaxID=2723071 RepID=UPI001616A313|nr:hypothetical protein [Pedobacter sp. AK013]MBB6236765.1 hypothetical protein [Pedobacter sp. AK013]